MAGAIIIAGACWVLDYLIGKADEEVYEDLDEETEEAEEAKEETSEEVEETAAEEISETSEEAEAEVSVQALEDEDSQEAPVVNAEKSEPEEEKNDDVNVLTL